MSGAARGAAVVASALGGAARHRLAGTGILVEKPEPPAILEADGGRDRD
jgi:hypothetical protein